MRGHRNSTAPMSFADKHGSGATTTATDDVDKDLLPELCPVMNSKNCFQEKTKDNSTNDFADTSSEDENHHQTGVDASLSSLFESLATFFIPIILQSVWGGVLVIRSLLVTYVFHALWNTNVWTETALHRYFPILSSSSPGGLGKMPSWPPPAFVFLALLTGTVLLVHPDGFTWIALRNIR